jgi:hypothetical protein
MKSGQPPRGILPNLEFPHLPEQGTVYLLEEKPVALQFWPLERSIKSRRAKPLGSEDLPVDLYFA